jgi:hypothetical protein
MSERTPKSPASAALVFTAALSLAALLTWSRVRFNIEFAAGALDNVAHIDGKFGGKPFQYRVLVPTLVRWLHELAPPLSALNAFRLIDVACGVALFYAFRRLARASLGSQRGATAASFVLLAVLFVHLVFSREYPVWYAWDVASVFLFVAGLVLLREQRWLLFYPLFALATLNRETSCFLTFAFVLTSIGRAPPARIALHSLAQLALWLALKLALWKIYLRMPGNRVFQSAVDENWEALRDPKLLAGMAVSYALLWIPLLFFYRRIEDAWLRRAVLVLVPFAIGMFFAGVFTELRIWAEMVPLVVLGALAGIAGARSRVPRNALAG